MFIAFIIYLHELKKNLVTILLTIIARSALSAMIYLKKKLIVRYYLMCINSTID